MKTIRIGLLAASLLSPAANALDLGHGLSLKGFGTLGMASSTNNQVDFRADTYGQSTGAGLSESTSLLVDSKLGLQLDYALNDRWHFTAQSVSKQREDGHWTPDLEWAFAKYSVLSQLDVRAGRLRVPLLMVADTLDVNYANPWVRPPVELYGSNPISRSNINGVDLLWRPVTGPVSWLIQPFYGATHFTINSGATVQPDDVFGAQVAGSVGDWTLRGAFLRSHVKLDFPDLNNQVLPALTALCGFTVDPIACQYAADLQRNGKPMNFGALGAVWDNGDYFVNAEYAMRDAQIPHFADASGWYVTAGARIKRLTPFISYARFTNNGAKQFTQSSGQLPGFSTNSVITSLLQHSEMNQATVSLGLRYDVLSTVALKFQWDRIDTLSESGVPGTGFGVFNTGTTVFGNASNTVDVFSLSMDFAF